VMAWIPGLRVREQIDTLTVDRADEAAGLRIARRRCAEELHRRRQDGYQLPVTSFQ
jgi:hypothetical protein